MEPFFEEKTESDSIAECLEIKKTIEELLNKLSITFDEIEVFKGLSDNGPKFIIKSQDSGLLIGYRGEHLKALSHIVRRITVRNNTFSKFTIDINNYQEESIKKIRNTALTLAQKVVESGQSVELEPMSSYERMVVHSLFSPDSEVITESVGEKDQRRIVIKPRNKN